MFFTPTAFYKNSTPPQQIQFGFDADYIMLTYQFPDGEDLDTKTRIVTPNIGQTTNADFVGFPNFGTYPPDDPDPIITHAGDNVLRGFESVLVNVKQLRIFAPSSQSFTLDARALWFIPDPDTIGIQPVTVAFTLWKGGDPVQNGCISLEDGNPYCWTNITATASSSYDSVGVRITNNDAASIGQRAVTLTYNLQTHIGILNSDDKTTAIPLS